jgi:hypothetical protein
MSFLQPTLAMIEFNLRNANSGKINFEIHKKDSIKILEILVFQVSLSDIIKI